MPSSGIPELCHTEIARRYNYRDLEDGECKARTSDGQQADATARETVLMTGCLRARTTFVFPRPTDPLFEIAITCTSVTIPVLAGIH